MNLTKKSNSNFTKYSVVVAGICMVFVCLGFCSSNKSLYLSAITEALSIPRSLFSINAPRRPSCATSLVEFE